MPQRRKSRRAGKGERRRQLLDRARELFARHGYAAVTPAQIAEAAGTTPAVFARNFAGMPAVAAGLVADMHAWLFADPTVAYPANESLGKLHALVELFLAEMKQPSSLVRVVYRMLAEAPDEVRAVLPEAFEPSIAALGELIRAGQQEGVFRRPLDPQQAAWELLRSLFSLPLFQEVEPAGEGDALAGFDLLLHGLLKTDV